MGKRRRKDEAAVPVSVRTTISDYEESPATSIEDDRLPSILKKSFLDCKNLKQPTEIQSHCWLPLCNGRDLLALAPTGCGKTLGYMLPVAVMVDSNIGVESLAVRCLVLVPTRELASQVCQVAGPIGSIKCLAVYGGASREAQVDLLNGGSGVNVVVGTPGRVQDLLDSEDLRIKGLKMLVLDECDRMLDMGFEPQVSSIMKYTKDIITQNVLVSATFPRKLKEVIERLSFLKSNYVSVKMTQENEDDTFTSGVSSTITQIVHVCAEHKKPKKLIRFIEGIFEEEKAQRNKSSILVFCTKIKTVKFVEDFLSRRNTFSCSALHGQMQQSLREKSLNGFKCGKTNIMVATDVAGRGIDIKGLKYVVNYDFPSSLQVYAHRIGRTGRAENVGTAFSFFTRNLAPMAKDLIQLLRNCQQKVDPYLLQLLPEENLEESKPEMGEDESLKKRKATI